MSDPIAAIVETLYVEYAAKIRNYIYRRTSDNDVADDLTAETFCKAMAAMVAGKGPKSSVSGWLYRIAHNLIIDYYRTRERRTEISLENASLSESEEWIATQDGRYLADKSDMEATLLKSLENEDVRREIRRLTKNQSRVLWLRFFDECPLDEIAETVGKSEGAVKAIQHRALANLRTRIMA